MKYCGHKFSRTESFVVLELKNRNLFRGRIHGRTAFSSLSLSVLVRAPLCTLVLSFLRMRGCASLFCCPDSVIYLRRLQTGIIIWLKYSTPIKPWTLIPSPIHFMSKGYSLCTGIWAATRPKFKCFCLSAGVLDTAPERRLWLDMRTNYVTADGLYENTVPSDASRFPKDYCLSEGFQALFFVFLIREDCRWR